ncbi:MAG TPA: prolyl oligopeptidase family serine peptidase, partial [Kofleriaceae bacterium]|nr:prolyl oligopeptidase family serine peptidase [Kofleriaceae bacterium]
SQSLAFQRTDASAVETLYLADQRHPERAPIASKDPRPGKPIATVDLGIVSVHGGPPRWVMWDLSRYPYLASVQWSDKTPLTLTVVNRTQTELAVLAVDAGGTTRSLLVDKDAAWIDATHAPTWLPDGSGFVWMTESHGGWGLDYHAANGAQVRPVVTPDVGLRRVAGLTADGHVVIEAAVDAREQHVWKLPLAGGAPVAMTTNGGVHHATVGHGVIAITSRDRSGVWSMTIDRGDRSVAGASTFDRKMVTPTTKLETVTVEDHTQFTAVTRPHAFDAKVRYPVLLVVEAGPEAKLVVDALDAYLLDQWYADAGFIVVRTDGRGTPDRGRDWQRAVASDLITLPMNDQIGALKQLGARYPELDLARVGVIGGYFAVMAVLLHPDVFAAAAATSPVTDWQLVDATMAERYMKTPATNAEGYRRASALTYASQLARPLLVLDDPADARVPVDNTSLLLEALRAGGKHADVAADDRDPIKHEKVQLEFFRAHLGPPVRPAVMPVARTEEDEEREEREEREHQRP